MTKKYEHTECPTCRAGLIMDGDEQYCVHCRCDEQAEEIGQLREACAAVLAVDESGCPSAREARRLCARALRRVEVGA